MFRKIVNILVAFLLVASIGTAQNVDRSKRPAAKKAKAITFPKFQRATLSNGLELIVIENKAFPLVTVYFTTRAGNFYEGDKTGASVLTSRLHTKGTTTKTAMEIAGEIDFLASTIYSGASWDANYYSIESLKKNLNKTMDILADCILNPAFSEEELQREVAQIVASYKRGKTDISELAENELMKTVFGTNTPYGTRVTEENISKITTDDVKAFYKKYFVPNNTFCVVNGDITLKEAVALLESKLKDWKRGPEPQKDKIDMVFPTTPRIVVANRDGAVQSAIRVGCVTLDRKNPDFLELGVVNTYLGGYFGSLLMQKLREEKSYTYGVNSGLDTRLFGGLFAIRTLVGTQFTEGAVEDILEEIKSLTTTPISDEKFEALKSYIIGTFAMSLETDVAVAGRIRELYLSGLPLDYYDRYVSSIQKMTKADFVRIAKKYFTNTYAQQA